MTVIWAILIFCVLIIVHEAGHFAMAKLSGMTVHEFSIGMGPKLFGFSTKNTEYSLRILPIGGYVKLEGEDGESADPNAFCNKSFLKRFTVLFAGAFMNMVLGFVIFTIVFSSVGSVASNRIDSIIENSAFESVGILPGDVIVKVEGENYSGKVHSYRDISTFISINGTKKAIFTFERNGETFKKEITPLYYKTEKRYLFGFSPAIEELDFMSCLSQAYHQCIFVVKSVFLSIWWLIRGIVPASAISGPVGIVKEIGTAAREGWQTVLNFAGFISVNLGVMNLLPIPALDGGRILFLIIEKIRGKKMNPEREGLINFIFFAILLFVMLLVTIGDVTKLV